MYKLPVVVVVVFLFRGEKWRIVDWTVVNTRLQGEKDD
jgi:hypothetical protein